MKSLQFLLLIGFSILTIYSGYSQNIKSDFSRSEITYGADGVSPIEIRLGEGTEITRMNFFSQYKSYFGLSSDYEFIQFKEFSDQIGQNHYRYKEYYKGIEVLYAQLILHEKNGFIYFANGVTVHKINMAVSPAISKEDGLNAALNYINADSYMWQKQENEIFLKNLLNDPEATYYPKGELKLTSGTKPLNKDNLTLVYRYDIYAEKPLSRDYVDVNANNKNIVNSISEICNDDIPGTGTSLYNGTVGIMVDSYSEGYRLQESGRGGGIKTFNMQNGTNYNYAVDYSNEDLDFIDPEDETGVSAHWATEGTYDFYLNTFGRNSFDNNGGTLYSYASFYVNYNNAFWDGYKMTYGDGDGVNFSPFVSNDVAGHEITHGVTQYSADLIYASESGALNESFSDIFGTAVEFYLEGTDANWSCGEDITLLPPYMTRSLEDPNLCECPDTYKGDFWDPGEEVHTNSGIQNFWFYLISEGGTGTNDNGNSYSVTGIGIDDALQIAYRNLTVYLTPSSNYHNARAGSIYAASDLFGTGSQQYNSVIDAWNAVGVYSVRSEFTADITCSTPPLTAHFSDQSIASPSQITSWEWDLDGDGITDATQQNPEWTYTETGIYDVTLTVSDGQNSLTYMNLTQSFCLLEILGQQVHPEQLLRTQMLKKLLNTWKMEVTFI